MDAPLTLTAVVYPDGRAVLVSPPAPAPPRERCRHCDRGREGMGPERCCGQCAERGHAGDPLACPECQRERRLLDGRRIEFTGP